jgi:L-ascorbate metabolism protein UlaG (beta-lactamase superfamily)
MGVREAAKAVELLSVEIVIPMHHNTFPLIMADPNELVDLIRKKGLKTEVRIMRPGETITV